MAEKLQEWYPSANQLTTPQRQESAIREVLRQFYALRRTVHDLAKPDSLASPTAPFPPGSGPTDTYIGGIPFQPFDVNKAVNSSAITYDKPHRRFVLATGGAAGVSSLNGLAGALTIAAGAGITVTVGVSTITIAATGSAINFADSETPAGGLPGTAFTLAHTPSPALSLILDWNGQLLVGGGIDFTLAGAAITTVSTIGAGDNLRAWYRY